MGGVLTRARSHARTASEEATLRQAGPGAGAGEQRREMEREREKGP